MIVLFDHSTPAPLARHLTGHAVTEARDRGWDRLSSGDLLTEAEQAGFEVLVTADKNMRYQQDLTKRKSLCLFCLLRSGRSYACTSNASPLP